jgi:integrase
VARRANLLDPESAKSYIASANVTEARKAKLVEDLDRFYRWRPIPFEKPNYRRIEKLPFIPLESEVDQLIAGVGKKAATFLQLIKETGIRPGEAWNLKWTDIDTERCAVTVAPEKNSNPRQLKISSRLIGMLNTLHHRYEYVFCNQLAGRHSKSFWHKSGDTSFRKERRTKCFAPARMARLCYWD